MNYRISNQVGKYPATFEESTTISAAVDPAGRKNIVRWHAVQTLHRQKVEVQSKRRKTP
jgi:hypothetical protein